MTTFAPDHCLLPLYDSRAEQGRVSPARPFGLTLSTQVGDEVPVVDLTDAHLDPVTQTSGFLVGPTAVRSRRGHRLAGTGRAAGSTPR